MSLYTAVFVRFMHGMLACFREAEIFVFHTRLVHVTPVLRERDPAALAAVRALAGLDLGAITPEEIAFSILAEMIQVRRHGSRRVSSP